MPTIICLLYGFAVALGGLQPFLVQRFDVRRSAFGRNLKHRKAACCPSAASLADITRPGGDWRRSRESYPQNLRQDPNRRKPAPLTHRTTERLTPDNPPAPRFSERTGWPFGLRGGGYVPNYIRDKPDERIKG